jgi:hypothetical protein
MQFRKGDRVRRNDGAVWTEYDVVRQDGDRLTVHLDGEPASQRGLGKASEFELVSTLAPRSVAWAVLVEDGVGPNVSEALLDLVDVTGAENRWGWLVQATPEGWFKMRKETA